MFEVGRFGCWSFKAVVIESTSLTQEHDRRMDSKELAKHSARIANSYERHRCSMDDAPAGRLVSEVVRDLVLQVCNAVKHDNVDPVLEETVVGSHIGRWAVAEKQRSSGHEHLEEASEGERPDT